MNLVQYLSMSSNRVKTLYAKFPYLFLAASILLGLLYFYATSVTVISLEERGKPIANGHQGYSNPGTVHYFNAKIHSKVPQSIQLNLVADDKLQEVRVNNEKVPPVVTYKEGRTSYKAATYGDKYETNLKSGENTLTIRSYNNGGNYSVRIAQHRTFFDYLIFYAFVIFPVCIFAFQLFTFVTQNPEKLASFFNNIPALVYFLLIAIVIRLFYFNSMGFIQFQHDYQGHIEYIKFFAENFTIPLPHQGWEYPQQPLYYIITGIVYKIGTLLDYKENQILFFISGLTSVLSCIALIFAYRLLRLLTPSKFIQFIALAYLAFTPSLIYMSSRINNDPWAFSFATIALFYVIASYKHNFQKYLCPALIFSGLALLTKVSTISLWLLFFILLISSYFRAPQDFKKPLFHYAWVGILLLSYTIYKSYSFSTGELVMVNSGIWPGQDLRPLDANYLLSFNFSELFDRAHAYWNDQQTSLIKRSFWTYQYGTMLFGEFDYSYWKALDSHLTITMQVIIVLALLFPIGVIASLFREKSIIEISLLVMAIANVLLLIKFMFQFPSSANSDFRYYAPCFFAFAYLMAIGMDFIGRIHITVKKTLAWLVGILCGFEALYILSLAT